MDNLKTSMRSPQEAELVYLAGSVMQSVMETAGQTVSPAMALKIGIVQDQVQDRFDLSAMAMRDTAHIITHQQTGCWPVKGDGIMSKKSVEYVVVNERMLGYRAPGGNIVMVLFEPGREPMNNQQAVIMGGDEVRPATVADFAQYRVSSSYYEEALSKPLIGVLVHHLKEGVSMGRLDPVKVAAALRDRAEEYAWATKKQTREVLEIAAGLDGGPGADVEFAGKEDVCQAETVNGLGRETTAKP